MDWKLELVPVPVTDVERAKHFYSEQPGSVQGLQLVVSDIDAARAELVERGVEVTPVQHYDKGGGMADGRGGVWNSFVFLSDPDGNGWALRRAPPAADVRLRRNRRPVRRSATRTRCRPARRPGL